MTKPSPDHVSVSNLDNDMSPEDQRGTRSNRAGTWTTLTLFALLLIALVKTFVK